MLIDALSRLNQFVIPRQFQESKIVYFNYLCGSVPCDFYFGAGYATA